MSRVLTRVVSAIFGQFWDECLYFEAYKTRMSNFWTKMVRACRVVHYLLRQLLQAMSSSRRFLTKSFVWGTVCFLTLYTAVVSLQTALALFWFSCGTHITDRVLLRAKSVTIYSIGQSHYGGGVIALSNSQTRYYCHYQYTITWRLYHLKKQT